MTIGREMTPAQVRAFQWLPHDYTWRTQPGRLVHALNSLSLAMPGCVETEFGDFGPRGGRMMRWRLAPKTLDNSQGSE